MRKKLLCLLVAIVALASPAAPYTKEQVRDVIRQAGGPEPVLASIATNIAAATGTMLDEQTQLMGAVRIERSIVQSLRLVNYEKKDISNLADARRKVASTLSAKVCAGSVASVLIVEHGAEYKYVAYSKSNEYLFEYSFNKTTCSASYRW